MIADSALGNLAPLCAADRAGLRFICPLRAVTGFRKHFLAEVGFEALHPLRYASERERRAPPGERSYRGALRPFEVRDPESGELRRLRVAYVHSSVEAREVAAAVVPNLRSRTRAGRADPDPPGNQAYFVLGLFAVIIAPIVAVNAVGWRLYEAREKERKNVLNVSDHVVRF